MTSPSISENRGALDHGHPVAWYVEGEVLGRRAVGFGTSLEFLGDVPPGIAVHS
jgi:hypothetical protein